MCVNDYISASRGSIYARIKPAQCRAARKPRPDDQMAKQKKTDDDRQSEAPNPANNKTCLLQIRYLSLET